jgi:hypothetical protein
MLRGMTTTPHPTRRQGSGWIADHRFASAVVREIFPVAAAPTSWQQEGGDAPVRPAAVSRSTS